MIKNNFFFEDNVPLQIILESPATIIFIID